MKDFENYFDENFVWKKYGFISVFDHWLTDDEANNCNILNYELSVQADANLDYLLGEKKFIHFYQSLSNTVICKVGNNIKTLKTDSDEFKSVLISSLREDNLKFFDMFYPKIKVRFKGGFDRTDEFFLVNETDFSLVKENIEVNNLFILGYDDYLN